MSRTKIVKGMTCILDNTNHFKFDETAPIHVLVERIHKRRLFRCKIWEVSYEELDTTTMQYNRYTLFVPEKYLIPEYVTVIRNPFGMPTINDLDIQAINIAINNTSDKKQKDRLIIIKEKLNLFKSLREV